MSAIEWSMKERIKVAKEAIRDGVTRQQFIQICSQNLSKGDLEWSDAYTRASQELSGIIYPHKKTGGWHEQ